MNLPSHLMPEQEGDCNVVNPTAPIPVTWGHLFGRCTCAYSLLPCPLHGTNHLQGQLAIDAFEALDQKAEEICHQMNIPPPPPLPPEFLSPTGWPAPPIPIAYVPVPMESSAGQPPEPAPPVEVNPPQARINVRNKGQRGEREVVKLLQAIVDKVHRDRGLPSLILQRNALQAHLGGEDIHGLEGFSVEVKFQESGYQSGWWQQALDQASKTDAVPILFYRKSKQKWVVKIRAYVNTPGDRDQVECDVEMNVEDFTEWFGNAYDERVSV